MIIEIALGIVLAVVILALLPLIIGVVPYLLAFVAALGVVGAAIYFLFTEPAATLTVTVISALFIWAVANSSDFKNLKNENQDVRKPFDQPISLRLAQDDRERANRNQTSAEHTSDFKRWWLGEVALEVVWKNRPWRKKTPPELH